MLKRFYRSLLVFMLFLIGVSAVGMKSDAMVIGSKVAFVGKSEIYKKGKVASSKKKVVSVKKKGKKYLISYKKPGKATLKYYNKKGKLVKKIKCAVLGFKEDSPDSVRVKAPKGYKVEYSSSNTKIATVDKNGKIKVIRDGTVTITVKILNKKGKVVAKYSRKVVSSKQEEVDNGDSDEGSVKIKVTDLRVRCEKGSVEEGYNFKNDDFEVYLCYEDGTQKRLKTDEYKLTWEKQGKDYLVTIKVGNMSVKASILIKSNEEKDDVYISKLFIFRCYGMRFM